MGPREIIIIALVVVLLFGAPKLPQLARAIGKSMRILKDETKSLSDDETLPKENDPDSAAHHGTADGPRPGNASATDSTIDASSLDNERRDER